MKIRIAAVTLSIAAIITAGVVNTAGAASGPPPVNPVAECNTLSCKGEKVPDPTDKEKAHAAEVEAAKEAAQQAVRDDEAARKAAKVKPAPAAEKPKSSPVVVETTAPAVTKVQCG